MIKFEHAIMSIVSRVARKRELARSRLLAAASDVIASSGVDGLRLRELTDRADIGFGSFYNHFSSKEELVEAVVREFVAVAAAGVVESVAALDDPAEIAAGAHRGFVAFAYDDPQLARLIVNLEHADAVLESAASPFLRHVLERGIEAGRFAPAEIDVTVTFIVGATIAVMRGIVERRLGPDAGVASARTLLRACGVPDDEARRLAERATAERGTSERGTSERGTSERGSPASVSRR